MMGAAAAYTYSSGVVMVASARGRPRASINKQMEDEQSPLLLPAEGYLRPQQEDPAFSSSSPTPQRMNPNILTWREINSTRRKLPAAAFTLMEFGFTALLRLPTVSCFLWRHLSIHTVNIRRKKLVPPACSGFSEVIRSCDAEP